MVRKQWGCELLIPKVHKDLCPGMLGEAEAAGVEKHTWALCQAYLWGP